MDFVMIASNFFLAREPVANAPSDSLRQVSDATLELFQCFRRVQSASTKQVADCRLCFEKQVSIRSPGRSAGKGFRLTAARHAEPPHLDNARVTRPASCCRRSQSPSLTPAAMAMMFFNGRVFHAEDVRAA